METHLFEIRIEPATRALFSGLLRWAKAYCVLTVVVCVLDFITALSMLQKYGQLSAAVKWYFNVNMGFLVLYGTVLILQGVYLYRFANKSKTALLREDTAAFNSSFRYMIKQAATGCLLLLINSIWLGYSIYFSIKGSL